MCRKSIFEKAKPGLIAWRLHTANLLFKEHLLSIRGKRTGVPVCRPTSCCWLFSYLCNHEQVTLWASVSSSIKGANLPHDVFVKVAPVEAIQKLFTRKIMYMIYAYIWHTHTHTQSTKAKLCILYRCQGLYQQQGRTEETSPLSHPRRSEPERTCWVSIVIGKGQSSPGEGIRRERSTKVGYRNGSQRASLMSTR